MFITLSRLSILSIIGLFFFTNCKHEEQYHWGEYEDLVYSRFVADETSDPAHQVNQLQIDIQKAKARGKKVPPGLYAHLGFMYHLDGKDPQAVGALRKEMKLFPESKKFISDLLKRLTSGRKRN